MVIETFTRGPQAVYARAAERGRLLPPGLGYLDSWIDERGLDRCFQLMECDDVLLLQHWVLQWRDLVEFEIVPVSASRVVREMMGTTGDVRT